MQREFAGNYKLDAFLVQARHLFTQRGLALYSNPWAAADEMAKNIIDLEWMLYEDILIEMIRQAHKQEVAGTLATTS